nr:MAG TPA: hypothetical protein [Caudoviricetes sp.]
MIYTAYICLGGRSYKNCTHSLQHALSRINASNASIIPRGMASCLLNLY